MLSVMREVKNFFEISSETGGFSLAGGKIALKDKYKAGQYILLSGSLLANGVYKIAADENGVYTLEGAAVDEDWSGIVFGLAVPPDFVALCAEIKAFNDNPANAPSAITGETVKGHYTWSKATGANGTPAGWREVFRTRLQPFRKMFTGVRV